VEVSSVVSLVALSIFAVLFAATAHYLSGHGWPDVAAIAALVSATFAGLVSHVSTASKSPSGTPFVGNVGLLSTAPLESHAQDSSPVESSAQSVPLKS